METGLDLDSIKLEMAEWAEWQEDIDDPYMESRRAYLGTVFALLPSGKYYMPWACGNVELCPDCKGSGNELTMASIWHGVTRGFRWIGTRTYYTIKRREWKPSIYRNLFFLHDNCPTCEGMGSEEAYLDSLWYEQAEAELESIGLYLCSGESDPCDLFAVESREVA